MINDKIKLKNYLNIALQHNLKYIKINNNSKKKILVKNYSLYINNNRLILNSKLIKKLINV